MSMRTRTLALLLVVVAATACSGDATAVPEGFAEQPLDGARFAYPQDWTVVEDPGQDIAAQVQDAAGGDASAIVFAFVRTGEADDVDVAGVANNNVAGLRTTYDQVEQIERGETEVAGAASAAFVEYTYVTGDDRTVRNRDVVATDGAGTVVTLRYSGLDDGYDPERAEQILDTLALQ